MGSDRASVLYGHEGIGRGSLEHKSSAPVLVAQMGNIFHQAIFVNKVKFNSSHPPSKEEIPSIWTPLLGSHESSLTPPTAWAPPGPPCQQHSPYISMVLLGEIAFTTQEGSGVGAQRVKSKLRESVSSVGSWDGSALRSCKAPGMANRRGLSGSWKDRSAEWQWPNEMVIAR